MTGRLPAYPLYLDRTPHLRQRLEELAERRHRSLHAEILVALERHVDVEQLTDEAQELATPRRGLIELNRKDT